MEWANVPFEEQETIININYDERIIDFYTSRKSIARRLERKVGKPDDITMVDNEICAISYHRPLANKEINAFLSKTAIVGAFSKQKDAE